MHKYRISKYNPQYFDKQHIYHQNEWTSYSDIGKIYDGHTFKKDEYLKIEKDYCSAILEILSQNGSKELRIKDLEINFTVHEIETMLQSSGLSLSLEDKEIIAMLKNDKYININDLQPYLKLVLRECFWCRFVDIALLNQVEFGYDYYAYVYCKSISKQTVSSYRKRGIFIEKCAE